MPAERSEPAGDFDAQIDIAGLRAVAERIDALAEMAELMGDDRQAG